MKKYAIHFVHDIEFEILPAKAIYARKMKTLILSDLHLGKINHFRKAGIPVPPSANKANMENLVHLMMDRKPERVVFIGDLFHSSYNSEWDVLGQVIDNFRSCSFELVPGNHDIMSDVQYKRHRIVIRDFCYDLTDSIALIHIPPEERVDGKYYISGHLHPAVRLSSKARQSLMFPCFWFSGDQCVLPAFGVFTGFKSIRPSPDDSIFAIVNGQVMQLPSAPAQVDPN